MGLYSNLTAEKIPLPLGDKTYFLTPLSDKIRAGYERYLEEKALSKIMSHKQKLGDDYYKLLAETNKEIVEGAYSFNVSTIQDCLKDLENSLYLVYLCIKDNHPDITFNQVVDLGVKYHVEFRAAVESAVNDGLLKKKQTIVPPLQPEVMIV